MAVDASKAFAVDSGDTFPGFHQSSFPSSLSASRILQRLAREAEFHRQFVQLMPVSLKFSECVEAEVRVLLQSVGEPRQPLCQRTRPLDNCLAGALDLMPEALIHDLSAGDSNGCV